MATPREESVREEWSRQGQQRREAPKNLQPYLKGETSGRTSERTHSPKGAEKRKHHNFKIAHCAIRHALKRSQARIFAASHSSGRLTEHAHRPKWG